MKITKLIMAIGIFICLFLPLSQCASTTEHQSNTGSTDQKSHQENTRKDDSNIRIIISSIEDLIDVEKIPLSIGFILPLLFCISLVEKKWKILVLVLQTVNQGWLNYLTFMIVWYFTEPLWGGWLLTVCAIGYSLITIIEWVNFFLKKHSI